MQYAKEYTQILNESALHAVTAEELLNLIESLPDSKSHIFFDERNKLWNVTQEWLVGGFAGRSFEGKTKEDAALQQIEYLNRHRGHNSIVGNIVTKSGWPDLAKVKMYLTPDKEDDEQELNENSKDDQNSQKKLDALARKLNDTFSVDFAAKRVKTVGEDYIVFTDNSGYTASIYINVDEKTSTYMIDSRIYHGKEFDSAEEAVNYIIKVGII